MVCKCVKELVGLLKGVTVNGDEIKVNCKESVKKDMDVLVEHMILSDSQTIKDECYWLIWNSNLVSGWPLIDYQENISKIK